MPIDVSTTLTFEDFVLGLIALKPTLMSETPESVSPGSSSVTVDAAHRHVLQSHLAAPTGTLSPSTDIVSPSYATDLTKGTPAPQILQRALVDAPLLPLGGAHLLYEVLWPPFMAATEAAERVHRARTALESLKHDNEQTTGEADGEDGVGASGGNGCQHTRRVRQQEQTLHLEETALSAARTDLDNAFGKVRRLLSAMGSRVGHVAEDCSSRDRDVTRAIESPVVMNMPKKNGAGCKRSRD